MLRIYIHHVCISYLSFVCLKMKFKMQAIALYLNLEKFLSLIKSAKLKNFIN